MSRKKYARYIWKSKLSSRGLMPLPRTSHASKDTRCRRLLKRQMLLSGRHCSEICPWSIAVKTACAAAVMRHSNKKSNYTETQKQPPSDSSKFEFPQFSFFVSAFFPYSIDNVDFQPVKQTVEFFHKICRLCIQDTRKRLHIWLQLPVLV